MNDEIPQNPAADSSDVEPNKEPRATASDTPAASQSSATDAKQAATVEKLTLLLRQVNAALIGQNAVVKHVLLAMLSNGHVLLEGVPGLGKTLLVRALAKTFSGDFKRIQFTPDLMPSDVTGHVMYDMASKSFQMSHGPVFTNLLLADEINRAPAKSQAALLEVMQEKQVTTEGKSRKVPLPFMVLATQNPLEQEGTYPLPEAELDRFLIKVVINFPSLTDEVKLTQPPAPVNLSWRWLARQHRSSTHSQSECVFSR